MCLIFRSLSHFILTFWVENEKRGATLSVIEDSIYCRLQRKAILQKKLDCGANEDGGGAVPPPVLGFGLMLLPWFPVLLGELTHSAVFHACSNVQTHVTGQSKFSLTNHLMCIT